MPNGGPDCCGNCWFNRRNRGEAGYRRARNESVEPYCEVRDVPIANPFWTYCANFSFQGPSRGRGIPVGPITRNVSKFHASGGMSYNRKVWIPSPDSEEIRLHLLQLLDEFLTRRDRYAGFDGVVIWQLGEFREKRAEDHIRWISENLPDPWKTIAHTALEKISAED